MYVVGITCILRARSISTDKFLDRLGVRALQEQLQDNTGMLGNRREARHGEHLAKEL
jgi:hypothetical protein